MKHFASQIRLRKWQVDEAQKKLAQLIRLEDGLRRDRARLEAELPAEQAIAARSLETAITYGSYAAEIVARREKIDRSLRDVAAEIGQARDTLQVAFGELKKFELAAAAAAERARARTNRTERLREDETALGVFRRGSS